jgi:chemotaxis protein methyltransferase CheR
MPAAMNDRDLMLFTQYVASLSGIRLDASKKYLLESRLDDLMRETGCATYADLYARARGDGSRALERKIVDAVSTNETFFFRDPKVFELLKTKLVPEMLGEQVDRPLAFWSAASSTGQEAYTLAMVLEQILFDLSKSKIRVTGTDISEAAVNAANRCEYTQLEVGRGLDAKLVSRYFTPWGRHFKLRDDLRAICRFSVDNLLTPKTAGPFDVILCRNVLIYFSAADKAKVVENLVSRLKKGGALILGGTESLLGVTERVRRLEHHGAGYYVLK